MFILQSLTLIKQIDRFLVSQKWWWGLVLGNYKLFINYCSFAPCEYVVVKYDDNLLIKYP